MSPDSPTVVDEERNHRFVQVEDGLEAQLIYQTRPGKLVLVHTEVPDALAGRGIAGRLVNAAVERARTTKEIVLPWCPYARKWLADHPDAAGGITIDWSDPPG